MYRLYPSSLLKITMFLSATLGSFAAQADYVQTNLVSDIPGFATITDSELKTRGARRQVARVQFGYRTRARTRPLSTR